LLLLKFVSKRESGVLRLKKWQQGSKKRAFLANSALWE
jgi:hypothetical protein